MKPPLLMVQNSGKHQLRLVVNPMIYKSFFCIRADAGCLSTVAHWEKFFLFSIAKVWQMSTESTLLVWTVNLMYLILWEGHNTTSKIVLSSSWPDNTACIPFLEDVGYAQYKFHCTSPVPSHHWHSWHHQNSSRSSRSDVSGISS